MSGIYRLVAVGKLPRGPEAELFERYNKRLRPTLAVREVGDMRGVDAALPARRLLVALDIGGIQESSEAFGRRLALWHQQPHPVCFVIGGADGLDAALLARADHRLSLGGFTWPHLLVRVMLAEQLYRAQSILAGHPYHRGERPG